MSSFHSWVCETLIGSADPEQVTARLTTAYIAFIHLQLLTVVMPANYGRYADVKSALTLTGVRFSTRWSWVIQESPAFLVPLAIVIESWSTLTFAKSILLAAFMMHYFNRSFVFPFTMRGASTTPLLPTVLAFGFCSLNGFFQAHSILHGNHPEDENYARMAAGLFIFIAGFLINCDSDRRLRQLRSSSEGVPPGKKVYSIPRGGLFEYVSAANYFGEIVEWTGFAIASGHIAALLFALSSGVFLTIRGVQHHRWYKERFNEVALARKAVIPFVI